MLFLQMKSYSYSICFKLHFLRLHWQKNIVRYSMAKVMFMSFGMLQKKLVL